MPDLKNCELALREVVDGALSPCGPYCMGYMNPGASGGGYISTMKLSVDKVRVAGLDRGTEGIVSYDRCEKDDAYIGQINMLTASSFCGLNGALWGYHLAKAEAIADHTLEPMFTYPGPGYPPDDKLPAQGPVPVYPVGPLLDAAMRLYGRMDQSGESAHDRRRFPPLPGAHVICANKDASVRGPAWVWSAIAVAIADDRNTAANLFIEDADSIPAKIRAEGDGRGPQIPGRGAVKAYLEKTLRAIAKSIVLCGQDQNVVYREIFTGAKFIYAGADEWGCALTCAPYILLARDAVPRGSEPAALVDKTIAEWEEELGLTPLPPSPWNPDAGSIGC